MANAKSAQRKDSGYVYLRRRMSVATAHRMHHPDFDDAFFGKCADLHGHNYDIEIMVRGKVDEKSGLVVDLNALKQVMEQYVKDKLDHKNLDEPDSHFRLNNIVQSAENIAVYVWHSLVDKIPGTAELYMVRVHETENNMIEYYG